MNELYLDIDNWVNLKHAPHFKRFHGCTSIPKTFSVFDWVYWRPKDMNANRLDNPSPRSILCLADPRSIYWVLNDAKFDSKPTLLVAGTDSHLSDYIDDLESEADRFSRIYFEAKNVESTKVSSFSMGFNATYIRNSGKENILAAVKYSDANDKTSLLFSAWGKVWPHLDQTLSERQSAQDFLDNSSAFERAMVSHEDYWGVLAKHYFTLSPSGNGVQAPKLAEAWMVKTIPIVIKNACFIDIYQLGYPLIMINSWDDITEHALNEWIEYYKKVDWNTVRFQLTNQYQNELVNS